MKANQSISTGAQHRQGANPRTFKNTQGSPPPPHLGKNQEKVQINKDNSKKVVDLTTVQITLVPQKYTATQGVYSQFLSQNATSTTTSMLAKQSPAKPVYSSAVKNPRVDAQSTLERWQGQEWVVDKYLAVKHGQFRKYRFNIYVLQRQALKIQHWYFTRKAHTQQKQQFSDLKKHNKIIAEKRHVLTMAEEQREEYMRLVRERTASPSPPSSHGKLSNRHNYARAAQHNHQLDQSQISDIPSAMMSQAQTPGTNDVSIEILKRVLEERQHRNLLRFKNKIVHKSVERFTALGQSFEERSFYRGGGGALTHGQGRNHHSRQTFDGQSSRRSDADSNREVFKFKPSREIKEVLEEEKANIIFENYNREREYMSRKSRSFSQGGSPPINSHQTRQRESISTMNEQSPVVFQRGQQPFELASKLKATHGVQWETPNQQQNQNNLGMVNNFVSPSPENNTNRNNAYSRNGLSRNSSGLKKKDSSSINIGGSMKREESQSSQKSNQGASQQLRNQKSSANPISNIGRSNIPPITTNDLNKKTIDPRKSQEILKTSTFIQQRNSSQSEITFNKPRDKKSRNSSPEISKNLLQESRTSSLDKKQQSQKDVVASLNTQQQEVIKKDSFQNSTKALHQTVKSPANLRYSKSPQTSIAKYINSHNNPEAKAPLTLPLLKAKSVPQNNDLKQPANGQTTLSQQKNKLSPKQFQCLAQVKREQFNDTLKFQNSPQGLQLVQRPSISQDKPKWSSSIRASIHEPQRKSLLNQDRPSLQNNIQAKKTPDRSVSDPRLPSDRSLTPTEARKQNLSINQPLLKKIMNNDLSKTLNNNLFQSQNFSKLKNYSSKDHLAQSQVLTSQNLLGSSQNLSSKKINVQKNNLQASQDLTSKSNLSQSQVISEVEKKISHARSSLEKKISQAKSSLDSQNMKGVRSSSSSLQSYLQYKQTAKLLDKSLDVQRSLESKNIQQKLRNTSQEIQTLKQERQKIPSREAQTQKSLEKIAIYNKEIQTQKKQKAKEIQTKKSLDNESQEVQTSTLRTSSKDIQTQKSLPKTTNQSQQIQSQDFKHSLNRSTDIQQSLQLAKSLESKGLDNQKSLALSQQSTKQKVLTKQQSDKSRNKSSESDQSDSLVRQSPSKDQIYLGSPSPIQQQQQIKLKIEPRVSQFQYNQSKTVEKVSKSKINETRSQSKSQLYESNDEEPRTMVPQPTQLVKINAGKNRVKFNQSMIVEPIKEIVKDQLEQKSIRSQRQSLIESYYQDKKQRDLLNQRAKLNGSSRQSKPNAAGMTITDFKILKLQHPKKSSVLDTTLRSNKHSFNQSQVFKVPTHSGSSFQVSAHHSRTPSQDTTRLQNTLNQISTPATLTTRQSTTTTYREDKLNFKVSPPQQQPKIVIKQPPIDEKLINEYEPPSSNMGNQTFNRTMLNQHLKASRSQDRNLVQMLAVDYTQYQSRVSSNRDASMIMGQNSTTNVNGSLHLSTESTLRKRREKYRLEVTQLSNEKQRQGQSAKRR